MDMNCSESEKPGLRIKSTASETDSLKGQWVFASVIGNHNTGTLRNFTQSASLVIEHFEGRLLLIAKATLYSLRAVRPTGYYPFWKK